MITKRRVYRSSKSILSMTLAFAVMLSSAVSVWGNSVETNASAGQPEAVVLEDFESVTNLFASSVRGRPSWIWRGGRSRSITDITLQP